jgi:L-aminopeptidase/D-esterase-like protein
MKNLLTDISGVRVGHADDSALRRPLGVENLSAADARVY